MRFSSCTDLMLLSVPGRNGPSGWFGHSWHCVHLVVCSLLEKFQRLIRAQGFLPLPLQRTLRCQSPCSLLTASCHNILTFSSPTQACSIWQLLLRHGQISLVEVGPDCRLQGFGEGRGVHPTSETSQRGEEEEVSCSRHPDR